MDKKKYASRKNGIKAIGYNVEGGKSLNSEIFILVKMWQGNFLWTLEDTILIVNGGDVSVFCN
jgi:hypothetical protein